MFKREIVADDNMHVCPHKRLERGTFDGMSLACQSKILEKLLPQGPVRKNLLKEFLDRDIQVRRSDRFIAKRKKISVLLFMLPQSHLTLPFFLHLPTPSSR